MMQDFLLFLMDNAVIIFDEALRIRDNFERRKDFVEALLDSHFLQTHFLTVLLNFPSATAFKCAP